MTAEVEEAAAVAKDAVAEEAVAVTAGAGRDAAHDADHIDHPTPAQYWLIALILGIVTGFEVAVPYISAFDGAPRVVLLFGLGGIKFAMVVMLFMHLKFDKPLYRAFFVVGLVGAIAMFVVVLLTFRAL